MASAFPFSQHEKKKSQFLGVDCLTGLNVDGQGDTCLQDILVTPSVGTRMKMVLHLLGMGRDRRF